MLTESYGLEFMITKNQGTKINHDSDPDHCANYANYVDYAKYALFKVISHQKHMILKTWYMV
jgi:hypothetical protein